MDIAIAFVVGLIVGAFLAIAGLLFWAVRGSKWLVTGR